MSASEQAQNADEILRRAYEAAAKLVGETVDTSLAFERATTLLRTADDVVGSAAILRALMARRIMLDEGLSLAQLADRIGTSKSRADQLVRLAGKEGGHV